MAPLVVERDVGRLLRSLSLWVGAMVVWVGLWAWAWAGGFFQPFQYWIGAVLGGLIIFILLVESVSGLCDGRARLKVDGEGIHLLSANNYIGLIPWKEIEGLGKTRMLTNDLLVILVTEPEQYVAKSRGLAINRWVIRQRIAKFGSPLLVSTQGLAMSVDQLAHEIGVRRQEWESVQGNA